ncbi:hypothetical protein PR048_007882 [Dryococelus australis]|uniref:Uncharacterized protein n=1 Tax=Dryococelus australis TaxID=614101 RepID=A0ABQ9HVH8_9NEOP|nr:hypothetical protein PR048_007882 [Dryococelus australis]
MVNPVVRLGVASHYQAQKVQRIPGPSRLEWFSNHSEIHSVTIQEEGKAFVKQVAQFAYLRSIGPRWWSSQTTRLPLAEPGSIPGLVASGVLHVGIVPDDVAGRRVFSGSSRFAHSCILALRHSHLISPSLAINSSLLKATQISQLNSIQYWRLDARSSKTSPAGRKVVRRAAKGRKWRCRRSASFRAREGSLRGPRNITPAKRRCVPVAIRYQGLRAFSLPLPPTPISFFSSFSPRRTRFFPAKPLSRAKWPLEGGASAAPSREGHQVLHGTTAVEPHVMHARDLWASLRPARRYFTRFTPPLPKQGNDKGDTATHFHKPRRLYQQGEITNGVVMRKGKWTDLEMFLQIRVQKDSETSSAALQTFGRVQEGSSRRGCVQRGSHFTVLRAIPVVLISPYQEARTLCHREGAPGGNPATQ